MNDTNVLVLLPAKARQVVYVSYGLLALVCASTQVGYNAIDVTNPPWLTVSSAVIAFLAVPIGALAALNVSASNEAPVEQEGMVIPNAPQAARDADGNGRDDLTGRFV